MKTLGKILGGLMLLISLGSCEKDEFDSFNPKENPNFNNGMINSYSHDVVIQWNELLSQSIDNRMPQPAEVKLYAMVTLAMHDALNNVVPKYETYALNSFNVDASNISKKNIHDIADAAVSQAARDMLVKVYPPATAAADALLSELLSGIEESDLKTRGINLGQEAAAAVLAKRASDFPLAFATHVGGNAPGQHQSNYAPWKNATAVWPANAVYAPNLGSLTPFGIKAGNQFRDEAPYPLNSEEYLADYNEVKSLGCTNCPSRTEDYTQIGAFWVENTSSSMNRLARALIVQRKLDGWEAARLIGLIQMSQIDAYIASFDGKYHYNFWRPNTAIWAGDSDGVEATVGDADWTPTFIMPPTPEFPSTHAYSGGAAAAVFKAYFKSDQTNLTLTSPYYLAGIEREYSTFTQMAYDNAISRIYIGYHFRHAVEVGLRQGRELGNYVFENNLRELKKPL
jgi:hypothetical protein